MKRIRMKKRFWTILLVALSGSAVVGGTIAAGISSFSSGPSSNSKDVFLDLSKDDSLDKIQEDVLKPAPLASDMVTIPGLSIPFNENNPTLIKLKNSITKEVFETDILFFLQSLMNSKSPNIEMAFTQPEIQLTTNVVTKSTQVNATFKVTYQNKSPIRYSYFLDNDLKPYSLRENYEVFEYKINGEIKPQIYDDNLYGYAVVGNTTATNLAGESYNIVFSQASKALNTKLDGFSRSVGYFEVKDQVEVELKKLTTEQIAEDIHQKQANDLVLVKEYVQPAESILKNIATNPTLEAFLRDNASSFIEIFNLAAGNLAIPFKDQLMPVIEDVLMNKSVARIIFENSDNIRAIVSQITFLEPFADIVYDIIEGTEDEIKQTILDLKGLLTTLIGPQIEDIPFLDEILKVLASDEGVLSLLSDVIGLIPTLLEMIPGFTWDPVMQDLLTILMLPDQNILSKNILNILTEIIKSEKTNISPKTGAILINDATAIASLKNNLIAKDPASLDQFFNHALIEGNINPYFNQMTVAIEDLPNETGFNIKLTIDTSNLYFANVQKSITTQVMYGSENVPGQSDTSDTTSGILIDKLLTMMIPNINEVTMNLLPQILYQNPNMTIAKLQGAISALANPNVGGLANGSYLSWLNSMTITENSNLAYDQATMTLNGEASVQYTFGQDLWINLEAFYAILPENLNIGGTELPLSLIVNGIPGIAPTILPARLWAVKNDYVMFGQEFNNSILSFDVGSSGQTSWQAFSQTFIDVEMPNTIRKIWEEDHSIGWLVVKPVYEAIFLNVFYTKKYFSGYYRSFNSLPNIQINDYDSNIYYDISIVQNKSFDIGALKTELDNSISFNNLAQKEFRKFLKNWTIYKRESHFDASILNSSLNEIFTITNNYNGEEVPINLSYDYIRILNTVDLSFISAGLVIPEITLKSLKASLPYNVYNGNLDGTRMQRSWIL